MNSSGRARAIHRNVPFPWGRFGGPSTSKMIYANGSTILWGRPERHHVPSCGVVPSRAKDSRTKTYS